MICSGNNSTNFCNIPDWYSSPAKGPIDDCASSALEGMTNILSAISTYNGRDCVGKEPGSGIHIENGLFTVYRASAAYYADLWSTSDDDLPVGFVGFKGGGLH